MTGKFDLPFNSLYENAGSHYMNSYFIKGAAPRDMHEKFSQLLSEDERNCIFSISSIDKAFAVLAQFIWHISHLCLP